MDMNGTDVSVSIKKTGDPLSMFSIIDGMPSNGKAVALCATEYWSLSGSFIKEILLKDNNFSLNLLKFYVNYIRNSNDFQTSSSFGVAQKKLLYQLMRIGEKEIGKDIVTINNYINQTVIPSFAGVLIETVSREIQKLKKSLILKINDKKQLELNVKLATDLLNTG
jgi:CRP-like cAMP-binding protein